MPNYLSPGVYVQEVEAGSRPIEGVGTAVAAFVGLAQKGPVNQPTLVTNWSQFANAFGDFMEGSYLAHSVYGYFLNGGGACYIVRIGADGHSRRPRPSCPARRTRRWPVFASSRSRRASQATRSPLRFLERPSPQRTRSSCWSARAAKSKRPTTTSPPGRARTTSSRP